MTVMPDQKAPDSNANSGEITKQNRWRIRWLIMGSVVISGFGLLLWMTVLKPVPEISELLAEATRIQHRDPSEAEQLLDQAFSAGQSVPDEVRELHCLLLARRGAWDLVTLRFSELDLSRCTDLFLTELGLLASRAGKSEVAISALGAVSNSSPPRQATALRELAGIYSRQQDDQHLLRTLQQIAAAEPANPRPSWDVLRFLDAHQRSSDAIEHLRHSVDQPLPDRDRTEMRHQLINRLIQQGQSAAASAEIAKLDADEQTSARTHRHLADLLRLDGKPEEALEALKSGDAFVTNQPGVAWLRGLIRMDLAMYAEAVADFQAVLEGDPFDLSAHLKLAECHQALGDESRADTHSRTAAEIRTKRQRINHLLQQSQAGKLQTEQVSELAGLYRELNDTPRAEYWQRRAAEQPIH